MKPIVRPHPLSKSYAQVAQQPQEQRPTWISTRQALLQMAMQLLAHLNGTGATWRNGEGQHTKLLLHPTTNR